MKKLMIIAGVLVAVSAGAQNHNAQYISNSKNPGDSVKSVYKENPADHAHTKTIVIKNTDSKAGQPNAANNHIESATPAIAETNTESTVTTVTQTQIVAEHCPDRVGTYAILLGIGGFILGFIIGFLVKGATITVRNPVLP